MLLHRGRHSASFTARELLEHADGAIDVVLRGEGEASLPLLLEAIEGDRNAISKVPGAMTLDGEGPAPVFVESLDDLMPARDLLSNQAQVLSRRPRSLCLHRVHPGLPLGLLLLQRLDLLRPQLPNGERRESW